jgi:hypothetical protein
MKLFDRIINTVQIASLLSTFVVLSSIQAAVCSFRIAADSRNNSRPANLSPLSALNSFSDISDLSIFSELTNLETLDSKRSVLTAHGTYTVPTDPYRPELVPAATFPISYRLVYYSNVLKQISYSLPTQLTGYKNSVDLAPLDEGTSFWGGVNSEGQCSITRDGLNCSLAYDNLNVNVNQAEALIQEAFPNDPTAASLRREVMQSFITEPCGVVKANIRY